MKKSLLTFALLFTPFLLQFACGPKAPTTPAPSDTPTSTPTNLNGYTSTPSYTPTYTLTPTATNMAGYTSTPSSPTATYTFTLSYTPTKTFTSTYTPTSTPTTTPTATPTATPVPPSIFPIPPQTASDSGSPVHITLGAADIYGNAVVFTMYSLPTHGIASITGNTLTYTPPGSYTGVDTLSFKATDGVTGAFSTEAVTITDTP